MIIVIAIILGLFNFTYSLVMLTFGMTLLYPLLFINAEEQIEDLFRLRKQEDKDIHEVYVNFIYNTVIYTRRLKRKRRRG